MSFHSNPREQEYVTISLTTPEKKTLQGLLQMLPSTSRFTTSQNDPPPRFNPPNHPFSGKKPRSKRKNRSKNRFPQSHYQQNPLTFRERRAPNEFPQRFQPRPQTPEKNVNLSNPLITPLLLAVLTQAQKMSVSKDQAKQSPAPLNFQYSSRLSSASKSRSPGMLKNKRKSVHWADDLAIERSRSRSGSPSNGFMNYFNRNDGISRMNLKAQRRAERKGLVQVSDFSDEPLPTTSEHPPKVLKSILKHKETVQPTQVENQTEQTEAVEQPTIVHKETPKKPSTGKRSMPKSFDKGPVWLCPNPKCRSGNTANRNLCFKCGMFKPVGLEEGEINVRSGHTFKKGDWKCVECDNLNFARRSNCNICSAIRPIETYEDFRPRKRVNRENELQQTQQVKQEWTSIEQIPLTESVDI